MMFNMVMMEPSYSFEGEGTGSHPCIRANMNCGEAGCAFNESTQKLSCLCIDLQPPDEDLRCTGGSPTATEIVRPLINQTIAHDLPETNQLKPNLLVIVIPVSVVLVFVTLAVIVLLWILRRRQQRRPPRRDVSGECSLLYKQYNSRLLDTMPVVGKNQNYALHEDLNCHLQKLNVQTIPKENVQLLEEIGEGAFGKVFKGSVTWTDNKSSFVAIKILKHDASQEIQLDFLREVKIMCSFCHENILSLLGIVKWGNYYQRPNYE